MKAQRSYRYFVVDVFTNQPFEGNSLAVFPDASGLDDDAMQRIARELNLSETTFVFPATRSDCVANVRIFTPAKELIFAGISTGKCFLHYERGGRGRSYYVVVFTTGPSEAKFFRGTTLPKASMSLADLRMNAYAALYSSGTTTF